MQILKAKGQHKQFPLTAETIEIKNTQFYKYNKYKNYSHNKYKNYSHNEKLPLRKGQCQCEIIIKTETRHNKMHQT